MALPSPGFLLQACIQVLRRFPATMFVALLGVLSLYVLIEGNTDKEFWPRTFMMCLLGLPLLTGLVALSESRAWDRTKTLLVQVFALVALAGYWFLLDPDAEGFEYTVLPGYLTLILVCHLFVAVAPYLNNRSVRDFWEFNKELFATLVVGGAFTFILFAGLGLAILAMDQLFDLDLKEKIYMRLFVALAGIFNTIYFLFHFPKNYEYDTSDSSYTAIFINLCKFILIPIVGLYFLILYAYSFKIIGSWSLPRGWVGSLVTGFSVAGIFTYLLNFYLPEQDPSRQVSVYRRLFWWVLLPLTILLFVAIGKRISDYGVTEMRFLVAELGVWLAINCLYFLVSKKDNIKFIPLSLAIFALTWAFGPLSARAVSERSQLGKISNILEQTGRLQGGKMKRASDPVTEMQSDEFESAVNYLERRHRLKLLDDMLPMPVDSLPEAPGYYGDAGRLRAWLGMGATASEAKAAIQTNVYSQTPIETVDIRGYAMFKPVALTRSSKVPMDKKGYYFQLSDDGHALEWWSVDAKLQKNFVERFDLQPIMKKWRDLDKSDNSYRELNATQRQTDLTGKKGTLRLIVETGMAETADKGLTMEYVNGYIFIK